MLLWYTHAGRRGRGAGGPGSGLGSRSAPPAEHRHSGVPSPNCAPSCWPARQGAQVKAAASPRYGGPLRLFARETPTSAVTCCHHQVISFSEPKRHRLHYWHQQAFLAHSRSVSGLRNNECCEPFLSSLKTTVVVKKYKIPTKDQIGVMPPSPHSIFAVILICLVSL